MHDSDERGAFLAAIRAEPDDDTPRLVLADWLQEHDEPDRAELIRVQCRLAALAERGEVDNRPIDSADTHRLEQQPEYQGLQRREQELLAAHRAAWLADFPADARTVRWEGASGFHYSFHRGMVRVALVIDPSDLDFENDPDARQRVQNDLARLDEQARLPHFAWVDEVVLRISGDAVGGMEGPEFEAVLTHPALKHVSQFGLSVAYATEVDLAPFVARSDMARLRDVRLMGGAQEDANVNAVALWNSPIAAQLHRIDFSGPYDTAEFLALVESGKLTRLRSLYFFFYHCNGSADGDQVLLALARSRYFPELRFLSIGERENTTRLESVLAVLRSPELPSLEWVEFDPLGSATADEFPSGGPAEDEFPSGGPADAAGFVRELTAIADACRTGDRVRRVCCGIEVLRHCPWLSDPENGRGLLPADLSNTALGDTVLKAIAASPQLARFIRPRAPAGGAAAPEGVEGRAAHRPELNLSGNTFGDEGALALARSPYAEGLHRLNVSGNRLSDAALAGLRERFVEVVFESPPFQ